MTPRPRTERITQDRVVGLFTANVRHDCLGYRYLGDWKGRAGNRCIESEILRTHLKDRGYTPAQITAAIQVLEAAADPTGTTLYQANQRTYQLLRLGADVQTAVGEPHAKVHFIDWDDVERNDFALAEEVTLQGGHERRPDIVLYLNGIAVAVIELKRSSIQIEDGIRQLITNQEPIFNERFFPTVQLLAAGSDAVGVKYGTVGTPETLFVSWREDGASALSDPSALGRGAFLDVPLGQLFNRARLLDLLRNFILFDGGHKKVPRPHQYFAAKAAQRRFEKHEGGVIWHTQGSGKSLLMVLLAKWILEADPHARILVVTDRDELDRQIEGVLRDAGLLGETVSCRITTRAEFLEKLAAPVPRLLCALLHKFNPAFDGPPPPVHGRFYVFVDECHRTQGGQLNKQMKAWLGTGIFIGFTGTPLLKKDKPLTRDVFGGYIHTYKFHEAVSDKVVLDLKYEARNVPQRLTTPAAIDAWFDQKTRGLNNFQKAILRKKWATLEELMSSQERKQRIIADIIEDFGLKPRLNNDRGTAILVAASIHDACHYFRLFQNTTFARHVAIITSYEPSAAAISREPANSDERYKFDTYTEHVLRGFPSTEAYEQEMKRRFIVEPANCKLLIVVSKLLTGFDAPSCTYIYLDNELHDHNLFQAICRTNRIDGDDKDYGHIVDYKQLLDDVQTAMAVYNSDELDSGDDTPGENNVRLQNCLAEGRRKLDATREALGYLCQPVAPPREEEQYIHYFCGDAADPDSLARTEASRVAFYKGVAAFLRAYSEIAVVLEAAGYPPATIDALRADTELFSHLRQTVKQAAGEELDIKPYEADMRHLINTYLQADPVEDVGDVGGLPLTDLIVKSGIHDAIARKLNAKGTLSRNAIAESIIHNVRRTIIRDRLADPRFFTEMSRLLDELVQQSRQSATEYAEFLRQAEELVRRLGNQAPRDGVPAVLHGRPEALRLFSNLATIPAATFECPTDPERRAELALQIERAMHDQAPAGWRGDETRERQVLNVLFPLLERDREATMAVFEILKNRRD